MAPEGVYLPFLSDNKPPTSFDEGLQTSIDEGLQGASFLWRATHAFGFVLGGTTFIGGTAILYCSSCSAAAFVSALLYTIGSFGFLSVDVLEFFTFTSLPLRLNILASAVGSSAYVLGSIGFFPSVMSASPPGTALGVFGFEIGSGVIALSQFFKVRRLLVGRADASSLLVEAGAGVGASFFLVGTCLIDYNYQLVLNLWILGSIAFTVGGLALSYRHFALNVL